MIASLEPWIARPGELVQRDEIARYAMKGCKSCGGRGYTNDRRLDTDLCDCARDFFLSENIFRVWPDPDNDALRWGPNPPTSYELLQVGKRVGEWSQFQTLVKSDKKGT